MTTKSEDSPLLDPNYELVERMRRDGATWQEVGDVLGLGRTAARIRYGAEDRLVAALTIRPVTPPENPDEYTRGYYDAIAYVRAALPPRLQERLASEDSAT